MRVITEDNNHPGEPFGVPLFFKEVKKMFNCIIKNGQKTPLYYHKTDGGAEYLTSEYCLCPDGHKEGILEGAAIVIRVDGRELEFIGD